MVTFTLDMLNCVCQCLRHLVLAYKGDALPSLSNCFVPLRDQVTAYGAKLLLLEGTYSLTICSKSALPDAQ